MNNSKLKLDKFSLPDELVKIMEKHNYTPKGQYVINAVEFVLAGIKLDRAYDFDPVGIFFGDKK